MRRAPPPRHSDIASRARACWVVPWSSLRSRRLSQRRRAGLLRPLPRVAHVAEVPLVPLGSHFGSSHFGGGAGFVEGRAAAVQLGGPTPVLSTPVLYTPVCAADPPGLTSKIQPTQRRLGRGHLPVGPALMSDPTASNSDVLFLCNWCACAFYAGEDA